MTRHHSRRQRSDLIALLALLLAALLVVAPLSAQDDGSLPSEPTSEVTPEVTPEMTPEATSESTPEATPEMTPEATPESTPETTPEVTPEATQEAMGEAPPAMMAPPAGGPGAACEMSITESGDSNPFTFSFAAINAVGIDSYEWFIDGSPASTAASFDTTFPSVGTYNILLRCLSSLGNLEIPGSVSVVSMPQANFSITPSTTGFSPMTAYTANTSSGDGLSFLWEVVNYPAGAGPFATSNATNTNYTFIVPGIYRIRLTASNANGSSVFEQEVAVNERPPDATFTLSPTTGVLPLDVTVTPVDLGGGPITSWSWDFGDGTSANTAGPHTITFSATGIYTIRLDYSGPGGSGWVEKQVAVLEDTGSITPNFSKVSQSNNGGGIEVCFRNLSTGPIAHNYWTFGDGSPEVELNGDVVCHTFASEGDYTVYLRSTNAANTVSGTAERSYSLYASPVAVITASATTINWGSTVNLNGLSSTGVIDTYAWDFNGDGVTDATGDTVNNVAIGNIGGVMRLGANPVRLTVTGPGGTAYTEIIIMVERLELTCDFTGSLSLTPNSGAQTYTSAVGNIAGRTVTYRWTVNGPGTSAGSSAQNLSITLANLGNYTVELRASTPDGSSCTTTKSVTVAWPDVTCNLNGNFSPLPNGTPYSYTMNVGNQAGRTFTYDWYIGATLLQSGSSNTFSRSWTTHNTVESLRVVVTPSAGAGCDVTRTITAAYRALTCSINGSLTPRPNMPSDPGGINSYSYNAVTGNVDGRALTYAWTVNSAAAGSGSSITRNWDYPLIGQTDAFALIVSADNGDGTFDTCNASLNATVTMPALICNLPSGDATPVLNETVNYTPNIGNAFGRPWTNGTSAASIFWTFEREDSPGNWTPVAANVAGDGYSFQFLNPSLSYRVRYTAGVLNPTDSCTSPWLNIGTAGTGQNFTCDTWYDGDTTPGSASANYTYRVIIDNNNSTSGINLNYRWVLIDRNGNGTERTLDSVNSTDDGLISSPSFNGASFGPIGDYTLRVYVTPVNPADSTHACQLETALAVGAFSVNFTTNPAPGNIAVGQEVCLTNTSTTSHDGIGGLSYTWDFGTADNSLGTQTSADQQPGCLSFNSEGTYSIRLNGVNGYGDRTGTRTRTFSVWRAQTILIERLDSSSFVGSTWRFRASGTNINSYSWNIYDSGGARVGAANRTTQTISQIFSNPGQYRVEVVGTGPLGQTRAEITVTAVSRDSIIAAFTPSQYAGIAPMRVCFTDNSQGEELNSWSWDFGNGQTLSYDDTSIPAEICSDYTTPGQAFNVRLRVTNRAGSVGNATNIVRTYTLMESGSSFSITPVSATRYCFSALLASGVTVNGWAFGDGTEVGGGSPVCHTFQSAGTYLVTMRIGSGGTTGEVVRPVTVNPSGGGVPSLTIDATCSADRTASFTITNTGAAMTTPDQVTLRNSAGDILYIGSITLGAGASQTLTFPDMSGAVTLTTTDTGASASTTCEYPPQIAVSGICQGSQLAFQIVNPASPTIGPMTTDQSYEIRNSANTVVESGTFQLGRDAQMTVTVTGGDPYDTYTFVSSGVAGSFNIAHHCNPRPSLSIASTCANPVAFIITNNGGAMVAAQTFTVVNSAGVDVTPANNSFQVAAAASTTITLAGLDPYSSYTFSTNGLAGDLRIAHDCAQPRLTAGAVCGAQPAFTVINEGAAMLVSQSYSIVDQNGNNVTPANDGIRLGAQASMTIAVPNYDPALRYTLTSAGVAGTTTAVMDCEETQPEPTPVPEGRSYDGIGIPDWASQPICGHGCPDFRLYHTDETGDWEIFRLDSADERTRTSDRTNLSLGRGEGIDDMAPSLSPNNEWIVFTSNRMTEPGMPENWEIFVAPTGGENPDAVQRVTFNTTAIDTDPVWGPNNWVAFESNRNGNWDLFAIDMTTGIEYQLTDDPADDINPFWSPDGSRLAFQSARSGKWQIYELTLGDNRVRRLSDGTGIDVDPVYSFDGTRIAFRTYTGADDPSVIMVMSAEGRDRKAITRPEENATNHTWSPSDALIAYQSDLDGDLDVYVYQVSGERTRKITDNEIPDYAPTWRCSDEIVIFTSDIAGNPDIYEEEALPITAPSVLVEDDADQLTFENFDDIYPQMSPSEENASKEGQTPLGAFGEQTIFLQPEVDQRPPDLSIDGTRRDDWPPIEVCPAGE